MPTKHETIAAALVDVITPLITVDVTREEPLPISCPPDGMVNIQFEDAVEQDERLGAGRREWSRAAEIEVVVQDVDQGQRLSKFEAILVEIGALPLTSKLGGLVDFMRLGAPENVDDIPMEGAATIKAAVITLTLYYETSNNPLEDTL